MHQVDVEVAAGPEYVWAVLADVARWPEWTSAVAAVSTADGGFGVVGGGVRLRGPGTPARTWRVTVLRPHQGFTWICRGVTSALHLSVTIARVPGSDPRPTTRVRWEVGRAGATAGVVGAVSGMAGRAVEGHVDTLVADLRRRCEGRHRPAVPAG